MQTLTQDRLKELLHYDPLTGVFTHAKDKSGGKRKGDVAGGPDRKGYTITYCDGKAYKAHRLAFIYMGEDLPEAVDHINGDVSDNSWANLKSSSFKSNPLNRKKDVNNTSGVVGVHFCTKANRWKAQINIQGKRTSLGQFPATDQGFKDAVAVRKAAEVQHNYNVRY